MSDLEDRVRAAARACPVTVLGHDRQTPAEAFGALAQAATDLGVDQWDQYGAGGVVPVLEAEVAELLGKPAAVFLPSGVMAQQAVLRVWCERRGSMRVALPDLAHPLEHESDGPRLLQGFRFENLTTGRRTPVAADLRAVPGARGLGAVQIELPLRDAGCLLPTWDELSELSAAARELEVPLHVDGARIWESQPFYDRPLAEIAGLADSVYVSFYKGLGGMAGAALAAEEDVVDQVRVWRQRLGGTLYRLTPYALSALAGLRRALPLMADHAAWARALAAELETRGVRVSPSPPHTTTFLAFAEADATAVGERLIAFMEREQVAPCGPWWDSQVPGIVTTEITVAGAALRHDPAVVAGWYAEVLGL